MSPLWSYHLPASVRGLCLARESGTIFVWDAKQELTALSSAGALSARWTAPSPIASADCADDGSAVTVACTSGEIWFLGADLKPRWQRIVAGKILAVAIAPFAEVLAVGDGGGTVHFLDGAGRDLAKSQNPRPLLHLSFLPERPLLIAAAEFGFIAAITLSGRRRWHDSPVAHCGALATTGDGLLIALASFSDGLNLYDRSGRKVSRGLRTAPCRLVALSYDGSAILTAGLDGSVRLHDHQGKTRSEYRPEAGVTSLALDALGEVAFLGLADGTVLALTDTRFQNQFTSPSR